MSNCQSISIIASENVTILPPPGSDELVTLAISDSTQTQTYSDNELMEYLEFVDEANDIGPTEAMTLTKAFLMIYARHELGLKIKACVEETGKCDFVADWY